MLTSEAPRGANAMPVGRYVRRAWPMIPAHAFRDAFKRRDVKINGSRANESDPGFPRGDQIELFLPDRYLPDAPEISFDDGKLIACVKPQGLPVDVDSDGIGADTLLSRIRRIHPDAQLCHRLDAQTGGLVLAAADGETLARAEETFKLHAIQKTYLALAKGGFRRAEGHAERVSRQKRARFAGYGDQSQRAGREKNRNALSRDRGLRRVCARSARTGHGAHASAARAYGFDRASAGRRRQIWRPRFESQIRFALETLV